MHLLALHPGPEPQTPLADVLAALGWECSLLPLDTRRPESELVTAIAAEVAGRDAAPLVVLGVSLGARLALPACVGTKVCGLVGLSFPFHKRGNPREPHGATALETLAIPMLIVQGSRDSHGSAATTRALELPSLVQLHWLEDASHAWQTRQASSHSQAEHIQTAARLISEFCQGLVQARHA